MNHPSSKDRNCLVRASSPATYPQHHLVRTNGSEIDLDSYRPASNVAVKRSVFSVEEILVHLRQYGLPAAIVGVLLGIGIYTYVQSRPPVYESTAVVLLRQTSGNQLNLDTIKPDEQSEYNLPQLVNNLRNEIGSDKFRLSLHSNIESPMREKIIGKKSEEELKMDEQALFLDRLSHQISIDVLKDSHMVSITTKTSDKNLAADLANAYANHFSQYTREEDMAGTRKVAEFLQSKADDMLVRVKTLETELMEYREKEGMLAGTVDSEFAVNQVNDLNKQLVEAKLEQEKLQQTMEIITAAGNDPEDQLTVPALAENSMLAAAYAKLSEAHAEVESLATAFGRKHPQMMAAMEKENSALENLRKLVAQTVGAIERQLKTSTSKVASLEAKIDESKQDVRLAGNKSINQELKDEQLTSARELYNSLLQQMNEAKIALQFSGIDRVRITEVAMPMRDPLFPRRSLSAILGAMVFGSCFIGIPLTIGFGKRALELAKAFERSPAASTTEAYAGELAGPAVRIPVATKVTQTPVFHESQPEAYPTLVNFSRGDTSSPREWVSNASDARTSTSAELDAYLNGLIGGYNGSGGVRGLIVTGNQPDPAKNLSAAALSLAASRRGLRTLLVSSEKPTPAMTPERTLIDTGAQKPPLELLAPFTTECDGLYFITDDAWRRIPRLCMETLGNAHRCVDLLVLDAPLLSSESDLGIMSSFADSVVLVRNSSEQYDHITQQARLRRILPGCSITGEFLISA